jgi:transposase
MAMTIVEVPRAVTGGVDTHLDVHVAAALDAIGGLLGVEEFSTDDAGAARLLKWLECFGPVMRVGVEGTGSYGVGLSRFLRAAGVAVVEVDRPNRLVRRRQGKSDPVDAVEAARAALSGRAAGAGKTRDGNVEAIRTLMIVKRSARTTKTKSLNQIRHLGFCAPDELRQRFAGVSRLRLAGEAAALRPRADGDPVMFATKTAMRTLGRRVLVLDGEKADLNELLADLVAKTAPELLALHGVGTDTAATLLVAAGDNPERLRSEAAWAHLCGVSPIEASSGKITRFRLNRSGDRQANSALWRIAMVRMRSDERTRAYVARRVDEGRSKPEIIRILKRYIAREVYRHLPRS